VTTTSGNQASGQVEQQGTGAATGSKLSRIEMNVLKTMITVIVVFMMLWSTTAPANFLLLFGVSRFKHSTIHFHFCVLFFQFLGDRL